MGPCDFRLIELIRQNRHLYDKSHPDFRNLEKKEITWRAIAAAQGSTAEICRRRFRSLRDRFVREKKQNEQQLLDGKTANPINMKMMFLWNHLRPHKRFTWKEQKGFQNVSNGALSIQNVYTVVPVDSSGVPIPNHPVASASYILVNATPENSTEVVGLNSTVAEVQGSSGVAEHVSPETPAQESQGADEESSGDEDRVSREAVAEVPSDVVEQASSKVAIEVPSNVAELVPSEAIAIVPPGGIEQVSPEAASKEPSDVPQLVPIEHEYPEMVASTFQNTSKFSKREPQSVGKKRLKKRIASRKSSKRNLESSQYPAESMIDSSCNAAFCSVVKNYLDKISDPMRLSSTRIKLLSLVHEEMYTTN